MGKNETGSPGTSVLLGVTYLEHHLSHELWSLMFPPLYLPLSSTASNDLMTAVSFFFLIDFIYLLIYWLHSVFVALCGRQVGLLFTAVLRLLIAVASLAVQHGL